MQLDDEMMEMLKEEVLDLLIRNSFRGEIDYLFAVNLARKALGIDGKIFRKVLVELHREGYWEWNGNNRIKLIFQRI